MNVTIHKEDLIATVILMLTILASLYLYDVWLEPDKFEMCVSQQGQTICEVDMTAKEVENAIQGSN